MNPYERGEFLNLIYLLNFAGIAPGVIKHSCTIVSHETQSIVVLCSYIETIISEKDASS